MKIIIDCQDWNDPEILENYKSFVKYMKEFDWDYPDPKEFDKWAEAQKECGVSSIFGFSVFDLLENAIKSEVLCYFVDNYYKDKWKRMWDIDITSLDVGETWNVDDDIWVKRIE